MKILLTGACGFVGHALTRALLARIEGLSILGLDNLMRQGSELNRLELRKLGVNFVHGDIRAASDLEALPAVDWVIDAAANPSVLAGLGTAGASRQLAEHNLVSLVNVLEYCRRHRAGLIVLSTSRVYSIQDLARLPLRDSGRAYTLDATGPLPPGISADGIGPAFPTTAPISLYGSTKLAGEVLALEYGAAFDFPVWVNRCGVLAGPGQFGTAEQGIFTFWVNAHLRRRPLRYIGFGGSGKQVRDALHPEDLAALLTSQFGSNRADGQRVYTVGGGRANAMSLAQLNDWCDAAFGAHRPEASLEPRPYDIPWVVMDNAEATRDFGWSPEISLRRTLEAIAAHARQHPDWLERSGR